MVHFAFFSISSLDGDLTVKLTDNALSRDLFPNDYHCLGDNENRPVKWLALDALLERRFSTASDVVGGWNIIQLSAGLANEPVISWLICQF